METELARLREANAHQRTQLADYHRVHNKNKASHELLESRVQELLKRWSDDVANRDQQLRIRSVHRFWNWVGKTCALVNPKNVTVLCEAYSVLLREGRVPITVMQRLRAAHGIQISTGAPTAPQTNDIVKIPPFTTKAFAPVYVPIKYQALPSTNEIEGRAIGAGAVTAIDTAAITCLQAAPATTDAPRRAKSTPVSPKLQPSGNEFKRISKNPRISLTQHPSVQSVPGFTQEMLDVYEEVRATKPWERYRRVGSILPDRDGPEGQHVRRFNTSVATFWDRYGQQLWERTYAPFGLLINNTDYDDTLVHFLCFPHPAWPVLSLNPPTPKKILAGDPGRSAIVMDYWVNRSVRFWPKVPPIPHSRKAGKEVWYRGLGDSVAYLAQRKIRTFMANQARKKVTFPDDLLSRESTNEVIAPRTTYSWNGQIANVAFWKDPPCGAPP
ncbi:hypothetical protein AaE_011262 [Aphanomyces astaci]|uniref:Uncharacterized protein n=1 Tax=Aphanomyces astaci TaxID=112090 RepID=A0A6A4ZT76_APHAT|nr:hypothetical protein AaE_011262 [Aphanomyces astaci]